MEPAQPGDSRADAENINGLRPPNLILIHTDQQRQVSVRWSADRA